MSSVSSTLGKTFPLEQQKLMLEIQDLEHTCGNRSKKDVLENKKLELEIDSLRNSIDGFRRFEAVVCTPFDRTGSLVALSTEAKKFSG